MKKVRIESLYKNELAKKGASKKALDERKRLANKLLAAAKDGVKRGKRRCLSGPMARAHRAAWSAAGVMEKYFN